MKRATCACPPCWRPCRPRTHKEQKNLILSNVQRIDCKDGFVVLYDLFERETRVEGRLATIDLVGNTAVIVKD